MEDEINIARDNPFWDSKPELFSDIADHCQLSCMIKCRFATPQKELLGIPMPDKFAWDENSPVLFQTAMSSNLVQSMVSNFKNTAYDSTTINTVGDDLNNIIITAANMSKKKKSI